MVSPISLEQNSIINDYNLLMVGSMYAIIKTNHLRWTTPNYTVLRKSIFCLDPEFTDLNKVPQKREAIFSVSQGFYILTL